MRRQGRSKLVARNGKIVKQCNHGMLAIGTHESFLRKGWLCCDCGEFILEPNLEGYGAAICAFKLSHKHGELRTLVKTDAAPTVGPAGSQTQGAPGK